MQIKTQLRVELDQSDINNAIRDYLAKHNTKVTADELANIKYTNTIKEGLKAVLDVKDETSTGEPTKQVQFEAAQEVNESVSQAEPEIDTSAIEAEQPEEEAAKEDVFPTASEHVQAVGGDEEEVEAVPTAPRKSLFNT